MILRRRDREQEKKGGPGCVLWKISRGHAFVKGARMLLECLECCLYLMKVQNSVTKTARWNLSRRRSGGRGGGVEGSMFTGTEATIHLLGFFAVQTWSSIFIHNLNVLITSPSHTTHTHSCQCACLAADTRRRWYLHTEPGTSLLWGSCGLINVLHVPSHMFCMNLFIKRTVNSCWSWQDSFWQRQEKHKLQLY